RRSIGGRGDGGKELSVRPRRRGDDFLRLLGHRRRSRDERRQEPGACWCRARRNTPARRRRSGAGAGSRAGARGPARRPGPRSTRRGETISVRLETVLRSLSAALGVLLALAGIGAAGRATEPFQTAAPGATV